MGTGLGGFMTRYEGRRRATANTRRRVVVGAGVAAIVAVTGLAWQITRPDTELPQVASRATPLASSAGGAACPPLRVAVSPGYLTQWTSIAESYAANGTAPCRALDLTAVSSRAVAADAAPDVDAWIPEDSTWVAAAANESIRSATPPIVASSPLVLAVPAPMAAALAGSTGSVDITAAVPLLRRDKSWADFGHASWGNLRVAIPEPTTSVTGALGFAALATAAAGGTLPSTIDYAKPTKAQRGVIFTEHGIAATAKDDLAALRALGPLGAKVAPDDPKGPGVTVTTEAALVAHARTSPAGGLVALHLGEGALGISSPLVTVSAARAAEIGDLASYLTSDAGQQAVADAGLRAAGRAPDPAVLSAAGLATTPAVATPVVNDATQVTTFTQTFAFMHQRISSLVVLDASGSMTDRVQGSEVSKIDLVRRLARATLTVSSPNARSGLVVFQSGALNRIEIRTAVPLARNGSVRAGVVHSERMVKAVDAVKASGGTPLYNAIRLAYRQAQAKWDKNYVNQIVVLSDGANQDAVGSISLKQLLATLRSEADPRRPVKVILIGYGAGADLTALRTIAKAVKGKVGVIRTLGDVETATREALFTP